MLTGPDLGKAIAAAMRLKAVTQKTVAKEFEITQPSVSEWTKLGRIDKKHINHLVTYFLDVVPPTHWGLPESWQPELSDEAMELGRLYDGMTDDRKRLLLLQAARQVNTAQAEPSANPGNREGPAKADTSASQTARTGAGGAAGSTRSSTWPRTSRKMGGSLPGPLTKHAGDPAPGTPPETNKPKKRGDK